MSLASFVAHRSSNDKCPELPAGQFFSGAQIPSCIFVDVRPIDFIRGILAEELYINKPSKFGSCTQCRRDMRAKIRKCVQSYPTLCHVITSSRIRVRFLSCPAFPPSLLGEFAYLEI